MVISVIGGGLVMFVSGVSGELVEVMSYGWLFWVVNGEFS